MIYQVYISYTRARNKIRTSKFANHVLKMLNLIQILKGCNSNKMYGKSEEEYNMMT